MDKMFCFQCEQTAAVQAVKLLPVYVVKNHLQQTFRTSLQVLLFGRSKSLCLKCMSKNDKTDKIMLEGLFTTVTNVNLDDKTIGIN